MKNLMGLIKVILIYFRDVNQILSHSNEENCTLTLDVFSWLIDKLKERMAMVANVDLLHF